MTQSGGHLRHEGELSRYRVLGNKLIGRCAKDCFGRDDGKVGQEQVSQWVWTQKGKFETGLKFCKHIWIKWFFFKRGFTTTDFIHEGKMPVDKDWSTMVVSRGTTWLEHSNIETLESGLKHMFSETFVSCSSAVSWATVPNPHKRVPGKRRLLRLCEGRWTICLSVESRICRTLWTKKKKKSKKKTLWKLISGVCRRQWSGCDLA